MSECGYQQLPVTPRLFQYLAMPMDDGGLADAALNCQAKSRWDSPGRDKTTYKDWQAYQNLLQLTGIVSMAGVGSARKVWKHVVNDVEEREMAGSEFPPMKVPKTSFTTAQELLSSPQLSRQSFSPAFASARAEPYAGVPPGRSRQKRRLSPEQLDLIDANREQVLAEKRPSRQTSARVQHLHRSPCCRLIHSQSSLQCRTNSVHYSLCLRTLWQASVGFHVKEFNFCAPVERLSSHTASKFIVGVIVSEQDQVSEIVTARCRGWEKHLISKNKTCVTFILNEERGTSQLIQQVSLALAVVRSE